MMLEWQYSSIPIQWTRFPIYLLVQLLYTMVNITEGEKGYQLYKSVEWINRINYSTLLIVGTWVGYAIVYAILKVITDIKLSNSSDLVGVSMMQTDRLLQKSEIKQNIQDEEDITTLQIVFLD